MVGGFHAIGGAAQVALFLAGLHQVRQALPGAVGTHHHHAGFAELIAHGNHVAHGKGGIGLHGQRGEGGQVDEAQGSAVGLGVGQFRPADLAVAAGQIIDDKGPAHVFFRLSGQQTRAGIRAGTGLVGHNHRHVTVRTPGRHAHRQTQQRHHQQHQNLLHYHPPQKGYWPAALPRKRPRLSAARAMTQGPLIVSATWRQGGCRNHAQRFGGHGVSRPRPAVSATGSAARAPYPGRYSPERAGPARP